MVKIKNPFKLKNRQIVFNGEFQKYKGNECCLVRLGDWECMVEWA